MAVQETIQKVGVPTYISERQQQLLNTMFGQQGSPGGLLGQKLTVPDQQVVGFTPTQTAAMQMAGQGIGAYQPYLDAASAAQTAALGTVGAGAQTLAGAQYEPTAERMAQFMDPYQQQVTQEALKEIDRQQQMAENRLGGQAVQAGAFGGSRFGLQQSELARNAADMRSRRIFEDLSRNYQQAMSASQAANQQRQQAATTFGQLGQATQGIGGAMAAIGGQQQAMGQSDVGQLMGIGGLQQQLQQQGFDVGRQNVLQAQAEPYRRLSYGQQMLQGLTPGAGTTQQTLAPMPTTNPYLQAAGAISGLGTGLGALIGN
mgnify:CR=1 FL=1